MFLEVATTIGALVGAILAAKFSTSLIAIVFGVVLLYSVYLSSRPKPAHLTDNPPDQLASRLNLNGDYPTAEGQQAYTV